MSDFVQNMKLDTEPGNTCVGRLYRCRINLYVGARGEIVEKISYVPLKRLSCPGCESCGWVDEDVRETVVEGCLQLPDNPEHGQIYRHQVWNISRDYETGVVDDWESGLRKVAT